MDDYSPKTLHMSEANARDFLMMKEEVEQTMGLGLTNTQVMEWLLGLGKEKLG